MTYPPKLTDKHFYAVAGLSASKMWCPIIKTHVPFRLSSAEQSYFLEEEVTEFRWEQALEESEEFLKRKHPSGRIYFKRNRSNDNGKLYSMEWGDEIGQVVGWFEPKADKQKEEMKKRMFPEMYAKS